MDGEGLKVRSSHTGTGANNLDAKGTLTNDWERAVEDAKKLGRNILFVGIYRILRERH